MTPLPTPTPCHCVAVTLGRVRPNLILLPITHAGETHLSLSPVARDPLVAAAHRSSEIRKRLYPLFLKSQQLSPSLFLLCSFRNNGARHITVPISVLLDLEARCRGSARLCGRDGRNEATSDRRRVRFHQRHLRRDRRRCRRRRQHAEVLHRRRSRPEDLADRRACHEPLLHRLRHRAPRLRQALPPIRRRRCLIFCSRFRIRSS